MTDIRPKAGRRRAWFFALPFAAVFLLALPGCQGPLTNRYEPTAGTGTFTLTVGLERARTILPVDPAGDFDHIRLEFTRAAGDPLTHTVEYWDGTDIPGIPGGTWTLTAHVYVDDNRVATGVAPGVVIAPDGSGSAHVLLTPIPGGTGVFRWYIDVPAGVYPDEYYSVLEIWNWPIESPTDLLYFDLPLVLVDGRIEGYLNLPSGVYLAVFRLVTDDGEVELSAILHVLRHMYSVFTHDEIQAGDFEPRGTLHDFIADAWNDPTVVFAAVVVPAHFTIIGVTGVTEGNFADLIEQFLALLEDDPFPGDTVALRQLVDAAIVAIYIAPSGFGYITAGLTRAQVEARIAAHLTGANGNGTVPTFAWSPNPDYPGTTDVEDGDRLVVTVGGYDLPAIDFFSDLPDVDDFEITGAPATIALGTDGVQLYVASYDNAHLYWTVSWRAEPAGIVTVSETGFVAPVALGYVTVYAYILDPNDPLHTVTEDYVVIEVVRPPVSDITVTPAGPVNLYVGDTQTFTATILPAYAQYPGMAITWAFADNDPAVLDWDNGNTGTTVTVEALAAGTAVITVTAGGITSQVIMVEVAEPLTAISLPWVWTAEGSGTYNIGATGVVTEINGINWARLGGSARTVGPDGVNLGNIRMILGAAAGPVVDTTATTHVPGLFDLSSPVVLYIDYDHTAAISATGNLDVKINNTSTGQANSVHGNASRIRIGLSGTFYQSESTPGTFRVVINGTGFANPEYLATSTITIRAETALPELTVTRIAVMPLTPEPSVELSAAALADLPAITNLAGETLPFPGFTAGEAPAGRTVTVLNTSQVAIGALTVTPDNSNFVVTGTISEIPAAGRGLATFTLTPAATLAEGTHSSVITVADANGISETFTASVTVAAAPTGGSFTITWAGFANPMASVDVSVEINGAGGTLTVIGYADAGLTNIRWYEGLNRLGTGTTLTRNNMPPVVTVWADVGDRTYSLVVDINNPPTGSDN